MSLDPAQPFATTPDGRTAERLAQLERRVRALESGMPTIQTFNGTPTATVRDGTPGCQQDGPKFWLRVNGVWRFTTLT